MILFYFAVNENINNVAKKFLNIKLVRTQKGKQSGQKMCAVPLNQAQTLPTHTLRSNV